MKVEKKERKQKFMNKPQSFIDKNRADTLLEKWAPVLDYSSDSVKSIEDDTVRLNTAILLENQEKWCVEESNTSGNGGSLGTGGQFNPHTPNSSDNYASGDARLPKVLIPMIRRTFPELISNDIVGVQPMSGPVGLAFALRYSYQGADLGSGIDGGASGGGSGSNWSPEGTYTGSAGLNNDELGYQLLDTRFTGASSTALSGNADWTFSAQDGGVANILKNFEITGNIPQVEVKFEKTAVEAGTRRLGARWSVELEQDLKNMNGIDVDAEITNAMSYEIQAEIDREMLMRMIQSALGAGAGAGYSIWSPASADGRWLVERNRDFYQKLIIEANRIAVRNRRGAANFVVATPRVCAILEMLPEFQWVPVQGDVNTQPVGIAKIGSLGGRFSVYRDTRTEVGYAASGTYDQSSEYGNGPGGTKTTSVEYALLGYKGPEFYDTGIIYCPYIPVMVQRTIGPNDFSPRVGLLTRYGVVDNIFGANLYYHVVIVQGLGTAFTPSSQSVYF
tara:strand:+ start:11404 stop:12918 length:1515 start_codon:yes stop_codon:yes gene_type:complete